MASSMEAPGVQVAELVPFGGGGLVDLDHCFTVFGPRLVYPKLEFPLDDAHIVFFSVL